MTKPTLKRYRAHHRRMFGRFVYAVVIGIMLGVGLADLVNR